jgi:glutathione S-transferase
MLSFHYTPRTCALATRIVLEEVRAPYEAVRVDFAANAQRSPEFRSLNPKARVPVLVTEEGVLTETPALLVYLAQRFPAAGLAPLDEPFAFARLQAFNAYLCATVHVAHAHGPRGYRWADDPAAIAAMRAKVPDSVGAAFAVIEDGMLQGPFVMGETYTIADPYLFTLAQWLESDGVDTSRLPRVLEHRERVRARPAVQRALAGETG